MQLKGLVRFFAIALIVISLYQLHFTLVVRNHEKKQQDKATAFVNANFSNEGTEVKDREYNKRLRRLLDSTKQTNVTYGITGAISYQKAKEQELNLGLDLQGGMSVTLEVELEGLIKSLSNNPKDCRDQLKGTRCKYAPSLHILQLKQGMKEIPELRGGLVNLSCGL